MSQNGGCQCSDKKLSIGPDVAALGDAPEASLRRERKTPGADLPREMLRLVHLQGFLALFLCVCVPVEDSSNCVCVLTHM